MKPFSKQESVIMVKETFAPRSCKFQLMFFLLALVLVALAFAAGVLFRPFITSHCGIRHDDDGDKAHSARAKRTSSVCMTNEDFTNLVEKATASLKSSLPKASKGTNSLHEINLARREPPRITERIDKGKLKKGEGLPRLCVDPIFRLHGRRVLLFGCSKRSCVVREDMPCMCGTAVTGTTEAPRIQLILNSLQ